MEIQKEINPQGNIGKILPFLVFYCIKLSKQGELNMHKLRKAFLFILGISFFPLFLGNISALIFGDDYKKIFSGYFILVYLLVYFSFPFLYRKDVPKRFSNKYMFYAVQYLIFWIFGVVLFVGYQI